MTEHSFRMGDAPAIRQAIEGRAIDGYLCPFCGGSALLISDGDLPIDSGRVEIYCDNHECDMREIAILGLRGEGAHARADVEALHTVDNGTPAEMEADGATVDLDSDGLITSAAWSMNARAKKSQGERNHETLGRRTRPTRFKVVPDEPGAS